MSGIIAAGSAKLRQTWLITRALIGFIPRKIIIIAGSIVIILFNVKIMVTKK